MTPADIDRLAAFCKLADKGYRRDPDGYWVQDRPGLDRFAWRPDESDDDCRVVLERFYEVASAHQKKHQKILFADALIDYSQRNGIARCIELVLLATPAEKCQAVLRVLENT